MESTHQGSNNVQILLTITFLLWALLALSGCSALISGYNSEFQCPETDKGKCVSVSEAYEESLQDNPLVKENTRAKQEQQEASGETEAKAVEARAPRDPEYTYRETLFKKLSSMIDQPATPIVVPPEVMRVLILSYTGNDNELFNYRYIYFFATEPSWIISTAKPR